MTNKPMLSVERGLLESCWSALMQKGQVIKALELRALLDKPAGWLPCSPELLESGVDCATAPRWSSKEWDGHSHWHPSPAAQHQDEPVAELQVAFFEHGPMAAINWFTPSAFESGATKLYAEQPAPVAVVMPERMHIPAANCPERINAQGWNACLDAYARLNGVKP